jgi:Tfp pilus assembly protein PilN
MIEINLFPSAKKKRAGAGLSLPDFGAMFTGFKDPLLLATIGTWIVAGGVCAAVWSFETARLAQLEPQLLQVRTEARQFRTLLAQKRKLETLRDSLETELELIREIDRGRYVWPHIMEEVTKALPDFTWLVVLDAVRSPQNQGPGDGTQISVRFSLDGRTSDIQAFTRFQRQLANSPWLTNIVFGQTQQVVEEDRVVRAFRIEATFQEADSAFIRTTTIAQPGQ